MILPTLFLAIGNHQIEVAETLIQVGRFLVLFIAARMMAELMVRLSLPTILGELLAGVLIGVSGFHFLLPPETGAQINGLLLSAIEEIDRKYRDRIQKLEDRLKALAPRP